MPPYVVLYGKHVGTGYALQDFWDELSETFLQCLAILVADTPRLLGSSSGPSKLVVPITNVIRGLLSHGSWSSEPSKPVCSNTAAVQMLCRSVSKMRRTSWKNTDGN